MNMWSIPTSSTEMAPEIQSSLERLRKPESSVLWREAKQRGSGKSGVWFVHFSPGLAEVHYNVQFPPGGRVEAMISALSTQAQDELAKGMFLKLQSDPGVGSDRFPVVESPVDAGVLFMLGSHCVIQFTIDPIARIVRVLSATEPPS